MFKINSLGKLTLQEYWVFYPPFPLIWLNINFNEQLLPIEG